MLTLNSVNKKIKSLGIDAELAKEDGYFYFYGKSVERCYSTSIYVHRLNQLTMEQWLDHLNDFVEESKC